MALYCAMRSGGPMICTQPEFESWLHAIQLAERIVAVLLLPEGSRARIEGHAEAIAQPIREDLLNVRPNVCGHVRPGREERIVARRRAVVIETQNDTRQVRVVRL